MADELRWEQMFSTVADGVTTADADSSFVNESSETMFIRKLFINQQIAVADPAEFADLQISKSRTTRLTVDNDPGFSITNSVMMESTGATAVDGSKADNRTIQFAKGELTLEPNEGIFLNVSKSSGGVSNNRVLVGYHF